MRTPAIIFVILPIISLVQSAKIGIRDGEGFPSEDPVQEPTSDETTLPGTFMGRSLQGLGRAAAVGNQEEAAGSQTLPDRPPGVPPLPFFNRPPTNSVALPVRKRHRFDLDVSNFDYLFNFLNWACLKKTITNIRNSTRSNR